MISSDAERLAALWTASQATVLGFIRALVPNRTEADDVLQKTAMACVRKFADYDAELPFENWAVGVARFEVMAWRRSQAKDRHVLDDGLVARIADRYDQIAPRRNDFREALAACLKESDSRGREALELFYGHGMQTDGVAESLGTSAGAVRTLIYRMRLLLKKCIEERMREEGDS